MSSGPYAHTDLNSSDKCDWEPLFTSDCPALTGGDCAECERLDRFHGHLNKVAWWTAKFAVEMFPPGPDREAAWHWGYLAGLWHDLGKFAPEWQRYLRSKVDPHGDEISGKVDHSTAGAQHAIRIHAVLGQLLAYAIAGHHSGLLDGESNGACQAARLSKTDLPEIGEVPPEIIARSIPPLPSFLRREAWPVSHFTRMLFSCLVDADFLATEAFMIPSQAEARNQAPAAVLGEIRDRVDAAIEAFGTPQDAVGQQRRIVVEDCRAAAPHEPGIFLLTVPTGGGKTLSSLSFALHHALAHGQRRVIYVVPFTSIIEQNADVLRAIVTPLQTDRFTPLIEHHSSLSPQDETTQSRLATENWEAPIVITTAVQFYESLFAAKTSRVRKLHHLANSVVILDEAQSLPVDFLAPCLRVLQELAGRYRTTVVLCTATQPAVDYDEHDFPIGIKNVRSIVRDPKSLFAALKRVEIESLGAIFDSALGERLAHHPQVLCIVNRRRHAQQLFRLLPKGEGNYHLSALMCPEHRSRMLHEIRGRLLEGRPARVVSTQLIEAGVDIDFPVVYRALAGLDAIAQAAGRCNRHGKLGEPGRVYVFEPEDGKAEAYFRETAQVARQLIGLHPDLLSEEAIHQYFDLYYYQQRTRWDSRGILASDSFHLDGANRELPFRFQFATAAEGFRLIENFQVPVIIPYDDNARRLIRDLRNPAVRLSRDLLRGLQRYLVQISPQLRDENIRSFELLRDRQFHALISTDVNYSDDFGITFDDSHTNAQFLNAS